ncbi:MAG: hypothetical protein JWQ04_823 [Pedosphaera sp.]|nr:hypothetical protein [Pedosphaera sp.]
MTPKFKKSDRRFSLPSWERIPPNEILRVAPLNYPRLRQVVECGGKRSATPLSEAEHSKNSTRANKERRISPCPSVTSVSSCAKFRFRVRIARTHESRLEPLNRPHALFSLAPRGTSGERAGERGCSLTTCNDRDFACLKMSPRLGFLGRADVTTYFSATYLAGIQ